MVFMSWVYQIKKYWEGAQQGDGGQQPSIGVIVTYSRVQRVLDWLITQVGQEVVLAACGKLAGARRPFPSNVAKALGLKVPDDLVLTPKAGAQIRIDALFDLLSPRNRTKLGGYSGPA